MTCLLLVHTYLINYFCYTSRLCHLGSQGNCGGNEGFQRSSPAQAGSVDSSKILCMWGIVGGGEDLVYDRYGGNAGNGNDLGFMIEVMVCHH